ncbi:MAG: tripartite tricarboxylate transporter substrate binding protein [Syntrophaceae bacterium]|nr:tripartite tricarboxylate transporter substrate binding protein [Syntrophaceae bacterium]
MKIFKIKKLNGVLIFCFFIIASPAFILYNNGYAAYPEKDIDFLVSGSAGGGLNLTARAITTTLKDSGLCNKTFIITNKGSGSGNIATAELVSRKGERYLIYLNSNRIYLNFLSKTSPYSHKDITPIARLTSETPSWAVRADSKYKKIDDVLQDVKADPTSVVFGIDSVPSNVQLTILRTLKLAGVDLNKAKIVMYRGGGEMLTQLIGGHVPVICIPASEAISHVEGGKMRLIGVAGSERINVDALKGVPTFTEQGFPIVVHHWRGVFGPPSMPAEARDYFINLFKKMSNSPQWKKMLDNYTQTNAFIAGDEFVAQLEKESSEAKSLLKEIGYIK